MEGDGEAAGPEGGPLPGAPGSQWRIPRRYIPISVIGQGVYGTVCEAEDRDRGHLVAIKQVRHLFQSAEVCKRTLRELAILRQLDHECVVRLHDVFLPMGSMQFSEVYIVLEICDSDMKQLIRTDVTLSMDHLRFLLYNLLRGIKYLGSAGVIHRDLKPGNILVNHDCGVKICDFNLACVVDDVVGALPALEEPRVGVAEPRDPAQPDAPGTARPPRVLTQRVVTRFYRAPEVILLQTSYTKAIDMWSAGCVFGELLQTLEGGPPSEERRPLFPGAGCFPLSPHSQGREPGHDMLGLIFGLLGTPSEAALERLERRDARSYVRRFPACAGRGLRARLPWADGPAISALARMLTFDAAERASASEALEHELFAGMRCEAEETAAAAPLASTAELDGVLDEPCLRRHFAREVRRWGGPAREAAGGGA